MAGKEKQSKASWQYPHVNVFKHCQVAQWRRCCREGDVTSQMDRDIKATIYKIAGSIPAGNFIQFPKSSSQSLNLTGRFIYLLIRPVASKYFVIHLELVTSEGLLVRLSFSNLFKEFKSSSTWLQLPFVTTAVNDKSPHVTGNDKWTILCMDLQCVLKEFLRSTYSHLKGIKLCGNLLVRNIFTSDIHYLPNITEQFGAAKLPKEMSFHVPKGCRFVDFYNFISFPIAHTDKGNVKENAVVNQAKKHHVICEPVGIENIKPQAIDNVPTKYSNTTVSRQDKSRVQGSRQHKQFPTPPVIITGSSFDEDVSKDRASVEMGSSGSTKGSKGTGAQDIPWADPIMSLERVIGFGGNNTDHVIFTKDCKEIVFPSHSLVVAMEIGETRRQKIFIGHTDKVCCLAFNNDNSLLASGQSGKCGVVRVWNYVTRACLAVVTLPSSSVSLLSFSHSGNVLCSVGKEVTSGGRNKITLWNTSLVRDPQGEVEVLATGHTDAEISCMRMAQFDDTRMVSCGWDNIRLWRLRSQALKFCPVNLEEHHQMHFTDISFEAGYHDNGDITDRFIYASTKTGHMFEIHYRKIYVSRVWQLLPGNHTAIPINAMVIHEAFCVTGSEDGMLRVWPLDFSSVILEIEHEGPVTAVDISVDGMKILAGTKSGSIGVLDATTKEYSTIMRSHVGLIQCVDMTTEHLISCSSDGTIRVWDILLLSQLYDFRVVGEIPCCVRCHPKQSIFACGFESGCVQLFNMTSSLMEYRSHRGIITGLEFTSTGSRLYSSSCDSTLAMYNVGSSKLLKLLGNTVVMSTVAAPGTIALDHHDNKLAVVGPLAHTITIMDPDNLNELVRLDITVTPTPHSATPTMDAIVALRFSPPMIRHLVVVTTTGSVLKFDTTSGRLLFEVHSPRCSTMAISGCGRYLVTAGNKMVSVWPYSLQPGSKHQVFIGHSDTVTQVMFNCNNSKLISVGEALFCWSVQPLPVFPATPSNQQADLVHPRHTPPLPSTYKPITAQMTSFLTPCGKGDHMSSSTTNDNHSESDDSSSSDHVSSSDDDSHTNDIIIDHESAGDSSTVQEEDSKSSLSVAPCPQPASLRYYHWQCPEATVAELQYLAPRKQAGIKLHSIVGYNGRGRNNVGWQSITGTFAYSSGSIVVKENLSTGERNYLIGHREEVSTIALSNDGQHLASACGGHGNHKGEIKIWKVKSHNCKKTLLFHAHQITCLAYSRDDRFLISVGDHQENMLALWSAENYMLLVATTTSCGLTLDICWDPHIAYECVSCGCGPSLSFWLLEETSKDHVTINVHEAEIPAAIKDEGKTEFTTLCYSTESRLFVGSNTGHITLWDTRNNVCIMYWRCGTSEIMCLACELHHGNTLSVGLSNSQLQLWKLTTPPNSDQLPIATMDSSLQLDGTPTGAVFDSALQLGVAGTTAGTIWYVDWHDNSTVRLLGGHGNKVTGIVSLANNHSLATCSHDGTLRVWSSETLHETVHLKALNKTCTCLAVCPAAMETFIGSRQQQQEGVVEDRGVVRQCAVGYDDGMLRVFELTERKMIVKWQPHKRAIQNISYSHSGNVLLSGCKDGQVAISNPHTGVVLHMIGEHKGTPVTDLSVAKIPLQAPNMDGQELWLVASGDRRVSVWSSDWSRTSCQLIDWLTFPGPPCAPDGTILHKGRKCQYDLLPPSLARFNPSNSDVIIYTGYGLHCCIQFYSLSQQQVLRTTSLNHWPVTMDISPQGHLIALGCRERLLTVVDYEEGSFQDYPAGHSDTVHRVEFSDNSDILYSLCDSTIYLWNILI